MAAHAPASSPVLVAARQALIVIAACLFFQGVAPLLLFAQAQQHKPKPPHPIQLDANITLKRDVASDELHIVEPGPQPNDPKEKGAARAFRVRVNLVPVNCNVFAPDGTSVTGLARGNFRIFEGGVEQRIAYFDAGNEPASVAAVIDASPSVLPEADAMLQATKSLAEILAPRDEISIVEFSAHSYLLLPFSRDRDLLENAIARVDVKALFGDTGGSDIYETVYLTAEKVFRGRTGRKAILLLTDGEESGLGLSLDRPTAAAPNEATPRLAFDDVTRALAVDGIEVFAVSTQNRPRVMTDKWLDAHQNETLLTEAIRDKGIPAYTLFLAELIRRAGGGLYFLRETQSGRDAFARIASNIRTQYTLGFYPSGEGASRPGWHSLRVEAANPDANQNLRVVNRSAYYVPAAAPR
ncbi:MAG: VWA domain-containing protein [Candidatus Acidiferrales bacterium]